MPGGEVKRRVPPVVPPDAGREPDLAHTWQKQRKRPWSPITRPVASMNQLIPAPLRPRTDSDVRDGHGERGRRHRPIHPFMKSLVDCLLWAVQCGVGASAACEPSASRREPTGTPTRRAVLKGTAAFAGLAAVQTSGLAPAAEAAPAGTGSGRPKANVLLVHGAWVDGSSWSRVIAILQRRGHHVVAVQLPLTSLAEDMAWTRHVLAERLQEPIAGGSFTDLAGPPAWRTLPSWFLVSTEDRMINPDLLRFMADRIGDHRGGSLQPRLAGLLPPPGRQADPGSRPGRRVPSQRRQCPPWWAGLSSGSAPGRCRSRGGPRRARRPQRRRGEVIHDVGSGRQAFLMWFRPATNAHRAADQDEAIFTGWG